MQDVCVIGVGRIGLCVAGLLAQAGHRVLGVDKSAERVERIRSGALESAEPGIDRIVGEATSLAVTTDLADSHRFAPGIVIVTVDTPTVFPAGYDHQPVDDVIAALTDLPRPAQRVELVLMCTTLPEYCDSRATAVEQHGYALSYNPVFVAQGSIVRDLQQPSQVLIGQADRQAGDTIAALHESLGVVESPVYRMSRLAAEIAKLATNCLITSKIAFANALGDLALEVGEDPRVILDAVGADARIGTGSFRYGHGFGGPCFPRDNRALGHYARLRGLPLLQAEATDEMNRRHLDVEVQRYLRDYPVEECIVFEGITYKPGTDIIEESQPLALAERIAQAGRRVVIHEQPRVIEQLQARYGDLFEYRSTV